MKRNVSELTGFELDWAVAKCLGYRAHLCPSKILVIGESIEAWETWEPSTNWSQGGPIIEQEKIGTWPSEAAGKERLWGARMLNTYISYGPTPLIASMRCFVKSRLGDEVDMKDLK